MAYYQKPTKKKTHLANMSSNNNDNKCILGATTAKKKIPFKPPSGTCTSQAVSRRGTGINTNSTANATGATTKSYKYSTPPPASQKKEMDELLRTEEENPNGDHHDHKTNPNDDVEEYPYDFGKKTKKKSGFKPLRSFPNNTKPAPALSIPPATKGTPRATSTTFRNPYTTNDTAVGGNPHETNSTTTSGNAHTNNTTSWNPTNTTTTSGNPTNKTTTSGGNATNNTATNNTKNQPSLEDCIAQVTPENHCHDAIMLRGALRALGETMQIAETSTNSELAQVRAVINRFKEAMKQTQERGHAFPMEQFVDPDWENLSVIKAVNGKPYMKK